MEDLNLDEYGPSIESKVEAIKSGVKNQPELEVVYREAQRLLSNYEIALEKCARYAELYPELQLGTHRATFDALLRKVHSATLEKRAVLSKLSSKGPDRGGLLRRDVAATELRSPTDTLAQDITHSLNQMTRTLRDELLRSETSAQILQDSTKRMAATGDMFGALGGVLGTSKRLIGQLWRRERSERWLVMAALTVYLGVLGYIVCRRLWLPLSLFSGLRRMLVLLFQGLWALFLAIVRLTVYRSKGISNSTETVQAAALRQPANTFGDHGDL